MCVICPSRTFVVAQLKLWLGHGRLRAHARGLECCTASRNKGGADAQAAFEGGQTHGGEHHRRSAGGQAGADLDWIRSEGEGGLMGIKKGIIGALMMVTTGSVGKRG